MMTRLRLIGRLTNEGISDPVPERVALHGAYRETARQSGRQEVMSQSDSGIGEKKSRVTLSEVQVSSSVCRPGCKTVTQGWFTCGGLTHTHTHTHTHRG